jgi:glutathione S-transferase
MPLPALPLLYSFRRCPYAMRARLALRYAGVAHTVYEVSLRDKPAAMLALSPKGTVPVLQLPDGRVIDQSISIMRWALAQHDPQGWLTQAPADAMQALIDTNDGPFKHLLDAYKYPERHPQRAQAEWRDEAAALLLKPLEAGLQAQGAHATPYLLGAHTCLADMALLPFVRQFAQVDAAWWRTAPLPALQAWLSRLLATDLFVAVMAKDETPN